MRISARCGGWSEPGIAGHDGRWRARTRCGGHCWAIEEEESEQWLKQHLQASYEPLLEEPWALDVDTTVKPLYGHQEDAKVGYNPQKPGRPSHAYHSYFIGNLRMVMDVEVQAGNQTAASFAQPELWALLDGIPEQSRPQFLRGDCNWGTERAMEGAEQREIPYLFKLKQSVNVKKLIAKLIGNEQWVDAGQQWQGLDTELQLSGWSQARRVVVLRRPLRKEVGEEKQDRKRKAGQTVELGSAGSRVWGVLYEYAVLVTSLQDEVRTVAQHYRDRGDSENNFDELKNQWGWAGFTTHDRKRCQVMARIDRSDLQLVDGLHAAGNSGQACRGDHLATAGAARHRAADPAQQSNHGGSHQHAFQGWADCRRR